MAGCVPEIDKKYVKDNFDGELVEWRNDDTLLQKLFMQDDTFTELSKVPMTLSKPKLCDNAEQYKAENPGKDACYLDESIQLYVSEGCALTCSYCSEKLMFPEYQSYPFDQLVQDCARCVDEELASNKGKIKVMFQADSVGDYGKDIGKTLPELVGAITSINKNVTVGLQGFNPAHFIEYEKEMIDFILNDKIFHLRLPIQSASQHILKQMGRAYSREQIEHIFSKFHEIGYADFSTDVLLGFPGETEHDFYETLFFILKYKPTYILLSKYMDFERLPSYELANKISEELKSERLEIASNLFIANGIYCSTDGGEMTNERRQRLNSDYRN